MSNINIPEGRQAVMPYFLVQDGAGFADFLNTVFGATELEVHRDEAGAIRHAECSIDGCCVMFGQSSDEWAPLSNCTFVYLADVDAVYAKAIAAGATSIHEPMEQPYGRAGGFKDPFGNTWWITTPPTA